MGCKCRQKIPYVLIIPHLFSQSDENSYTTFAIYSDHLHYLCIECNYKYEPYIIIDMYTITTNKSGTRSITVTDEHLCTIEKYQLLTGLLDSNGIVDEGVLDKLKLTVRSLIASQSDCKDLLDLCVDVIFHDNMKALGLSALIELYHDWSAEDELAIEE